MTSALTPDLQGHVEIQLSISSNLGAGTLKILLEPLQSGTIMGHFFLKISKFKTRVQKLNLYDMFLLTFSSKKKL
jgi:hypothetical protein